MTVRFPAFAAAWSDDVCGGGGASSYNPLTDWTTPPVHAVWAADPLWTPPADGGAVSSWRNGGSGYTQGAYIGENGLVLPGTDVDYTYTPHAAPLAISGDIDLIAHVTPTDWTPSVEKAFIARGNLSSGTNTNYYLGLNNPSGTIRVSWGDGTTLQTVYSTVATGVTDGTPKWVRATIDVDNGAGGYDVKFYLSDDGVSWTQLGATVTGGSTTSLYSSFIQALDVGATVSGASRRFTGTIHRVIVKDGIDGTTVFDADFESATPGISAFTESSVNAATVRVVSNVYPSQGTSAAQPTYDASNAAFNGQPTVNFDGTDDALLADITNISAPYWVVLLTTGNPGDLVFGLGNGSQAYGMGVRVTDAYEIRGPNSLEGGTDDGAPHLWVGAFNGASSGLDIDGTTVASGDIGSTVPLAYMSLACGNLNGGSLFAFALTDMHLALVFTSDPRLQPEWPALVEWVEDTYGITVS